MARTLGAMNYTVREHGMKITIETLKRTIAMLKRDKNAQAKVIKELQAALIAAQRK